MTTDPYSGAPESFEAAWPQISGALAAALGRDGVPSSLSEDVVQEVGCRLLVRWDSLDSSTSLLPLALTIARNLVVDHHRRFARIDGPDKLVDDAAPDNVEAQALARVQLGAVHRSLREMSPRYRKLLLAEAGYVRSEEAPGPATRVARTRARQGLRLLMERRPDVAWGFGSPFAGLFRSLARWPRGVMERIDWATLGQAASGLAIFIASLVIVAAGPDASLPGTRGEFPDHGNVLFDPTSHSTKNRHPSGTSVRGTLGHSRDEHTSRGPSEGEAEESGSLLSPAGGIDKGQGSSDGGFGVHGIEESGEGKTSLMDEPLEWRYGVRYRNPQCVRRAARGKPTTSCDTGHEAEASAALRHGDSEFEIDPND